MASGVEYPARARYQRRDVADTYDGRRFTSLKGRWTDRREKCHVLRALQIAGAAGHALDVPCGTGRFTELLLAAGFTVTAADISRAMIRHAGRRTEGCESRVHFVQGDVENLQFPDNAFDVVVTVRLLHHIPPPLHVNVLSELSRVTKRWLIISYSSKYSLQSVRRDLRALVGGERRFSISPRLFRHEVRLAGLRVAHECHLFPVVSESVFALLEKDDTNAR